LAVFVPTGFPHKAFPVAI